MTNMTSDNVFQGAIFKGSNITMILVRHNDKPWISSELKKEIRKRDRLRHFEY
jgi:hypothetical protein